MEVTDGARSIINDCDDAIKTLDALYQELQNRFQLFMEAGVRNIVEYNEMFKKGVFDSKKEIENGLRHHYLPYISFYIFSQWLNHLPIFQVLPLFQESVYNAFHLYQPLNKVL